MVPSEEQELEFDRIMTDMTLLRPPFCPYIVHMDCIFLSLHCASLYADRDLLLALMVLPEPCQVYLLSYTLTNHRTARYALSLFDPRMSAWAERPSFSADASLACQGSRQCVLLFSLL